VSVSHPPGRLPPGQFPGIGPPADQPGTYMGRPLASWRRRLAAFLLDELIAIGPWLAALLALLVYDTLLGGDVETLSDGAAIVLVIGLGGTYLLIWPVWIYNFWIRQGRTGRSWAKSWLGLRVVSVQDGQPPGVKRGIARDLCHIFIDAIAYVGFLWPLWDARRQTFADMIVQTMVISERPPR
jgi:uncharacterized RDD family membrane protein YckC